MDIRRTFDILPHLQQKYNKPDCFAAKIDGKYVPVSTDTVVEKVNQTSLGLRSLGIGKDDKVAIISMNRPEWMFADFGIAQLGATSVPMYPSITVEDYKYIFTDAGVKAVFVSDKKLLDKVREATQGLNIPPENVFTFDKIEGARHFDELLELGKKATPPTWSP
ncbi:AMP-binding protein [Hymenobacter sp. J193]|uniref:AMP-binding protein n=1 Tax=Hymenobacter sp. J193 TaxID=2898429 RepID=UPI002151CB11|nr:AMP-binding protein [Hymenobacter sp. J193]